MKYNELTLTKQVTPRRAGRGISAGRGKTAGRGTKGQGSRKSPTRYGFEGGQMPLYMRLPKLRGFKSHRSVAECVYTGQLETLKKTIIDTNALFDAGLISSPNVRVKLLLKGELTSKKDIKLQSASKQAAEAVEKAGGSFTQIEQIPRKSKKSEKTD
jgi:large subunit ribosomal protein L15